MKNLKSVLLALCAIVCTNLFGASITTLDITSADETKEIQIALKSNGNGIIKLSIWDDRECILHNEFSAMRSLEKSVDLSDQEQGVYTLRIEDEREVKTYNVIVGKASVNVNDKPTNKSFKPMFVLQQEDKKLNVNWLMNSFQDAKVTIRNSNNQVIFERKFKDILILGKRFDMKFYDEGFYNLTVKNDDYAFDYAFKL